ncbi:hypothetical protein BV20DRAFT_1054178 [Pilatotrama ljubarskyi]|nr:hypothetical protein BV20DRAFT_1054178 [Pilatotrama ljubarskyi]
MAMPGLQLRDTCPALRTIVWGVEELEDLLWRPEDFSGPVSLPGGSGSTSEEARKNGPPQPAPSKMQAYERMLFSALPALERVAAYDLDDCAPAEDGVWGWVYTRKNKDDELIDDAVLEMDAWRRRAVNEATATA